jgi:hypothetical protein
MRCIIALSLGLDLAFGMNLLAKPSFATHFAPFATSSDFEQSSTLKSCLWTLHGLPDVVS